MRARSVYVDARSADALLDTVVAADARTTDGTIAWRKGARIGAADRDALAMPQLEGPAGVARYPRYDG